jgi:hypothetical protein
MSSVSLVLQPRVARFQAKCRGEAGFDVSQADNIHQAASRRRIWGFCHTLRRVQRCGLGGNGGP